jgi:hypothetical protein
VLGQPSTPSIIAKATVPKGRVRRALATPVFWLLALSYGGHAFMFTGLTFHIIPLLTERGFALPMIIAAYTLVGPFQVIGRIVVFALEKRIDVRLAGMVGTSLPVIGLVLLMLAAPGSPLIYFFAIFYGSGMGIKTIVQATAGPEFLGREGYGALQGTFAGINFAIQAATPFALALLWSLMGGYDQVIWILFAGAALSALAFIGALMARPQTPASSV